LSRDQAAEGYVAEWEWYLADEKAVLFTGRQEKPGMFQL